MRQGDGGVDVVAKGVVNALEDLIGGVLMGLSRVGVRHGDGVRSGVVSKRAETQGENQSQRQENADELLHCFHLLQINKELK